MVSNADGYGKHTRVVGGVAPSRAPSSCASKPTRPCEFIAASTLHRRHMPDGNELKACFPHLPRLRRRRPISFHPECTCQLPTTH